MALNKDKDLFHNLDHKDDNAMAEKLKAEGEAIFKEIVDNDIHLKVNPLTGNRTMPTHIANAVRGVIDKNPLEKINLTELERIVYHARCVQRAYDTWRPSTWNTYKTHKELTRKTCDWVNKVANALE